MKATVIFGSDRGGPVEISGERIGDAVKTSFRSLAARMYLGNAAGYRLHSLRVEVSPKNHYVTKSGTHLITNPGTVPPDAIGRPAQLVVRHYGLDLAHQPASKELMETKFDMVVPLESESCEIPTNWCKPN